MALLPAGNFDLICIVIKSALLVWCSKSKLCLVLLIFLNIIHVLVMF